MCIKVIFISFSVCVCVCVCACAPDILVEGLHEWILSLHHMSLEFEFRLAYDPEHGDSVYTHT